MSDRRVYWTEDGREYFDDEYALSQLLADDVLFANSRRYIEGGYSLKGVDAHGNPAEQHIPERIAEDTVVLFVICNDTFYWATADAEAIPLEEVKTLYKLWEADRTWGSTQWVCRRRKMRPQHCIMDSMKAAGAWTEELEALPVRPREFGNP